MWPRSVLPHGRKTAWKGRDFFVRVRQGYLYRARKHDRFEIIDAGNPLQSVQADVRLKINEFIRRVRSG